MDLKQLIYFKTIVEQGTILAAAKTLHMAQPPLSIKLKELEEELGVTLLYRHPRKVELTKEGRHFYKRTLQILELCNETKKEVKDLSQYQKIHIGVTSSNGGIFLQAEFDDFIQNHPNLIYEIHEGNTYELIDLIKSHQIDLAFIRTPFDSTDLNYYALKKEPMIAVGSKEYLQNVKEITIVDLENYPLSIYRRYQHLLNECFMNHHITMNTRYINDDCRTALLWANQNRSIAIVPYSALNLKVISPDLCIVPIKQEELETSTVLIWHQHNKLPSLIEELIQHYQKELL